MYKIEIDSKKFLIWSVFIFLSLLILFPLFTLMFTGEVILIVLLISVIKNNKSNKERNILIVFLVLLMIFGLTLSSRIIGNKEEAKYNKLEANIGKKIDYNVDSKIEEIVNYKFNTVNSNVKKEVKMELQKEYDEKISKLKEDFDKQLEEVKKRKEVSSNQPVEENKSTGQGPEKGSEKEVGEMVWISATGKCYHRFNKCGKMNPNNAHQISKSNAEKNYRPCSKCY